MPYIAACAFVERRPILFHRYGRTPEKGFDQKEWRFRVRDFTFCNEAKDCRLTKASRPVVLQSQVSQNES